MANNRHQLGYEIESALRDVLPSMFHDKIDKITQLLLLSISDKISDEDLLFEINQEPSLLEAVKNLRGQSISVADSVISFGSNNKISDATLGDVAAGNIIHITINNFLSNGKPTTKKPTKKFLKEGVLKAYPYLFSIACGFVLLFFVYSAGSRNESRFSIWSNPQERIAFAPVGAVTSGLNPTPVPLTLTDSMIPIETETYPPMCHKGRVIVDEILVRSQPGFHGSISGRLILNDRIEIECNTKRLENNLSWVLIKNTPQDLLGWIPEQDIEYDLE